MSLFFISSLVVIGWLLIFYFALKMREEYAKHTTEKDYCNINDQKPCIEPNEWFAMIENGYPALEKEYLRLEPTKMPMNKAKTEALASVRAHWLRDRDSNPGFRVQSAASYH